MIMKAGVQKSTNITYFMPFHLRSMISIFCLSRAINETNNLFCNILMRTREERREVGLLRTERAMIRVLCGVKLIDRKS